MAEDHRRVEPREMAIGMRSDPERIRELMDERERRERATRGRPEHSFDEVLEQQDEDEEPAREAEEASTDAPAPAPVPLARVPPDPRMDALHRMLDEGGGKR